MRLRVTGVVAFVMAMLAIAHHVDDHVAMEPLAIFESKLHRAEAGFGIVAVDVENRRLDHQRDVGAIGRGARRFRGRGEPDLVVDHQVDGAAGVDSRRSAKN